MKAASLFLSMGGGGDLRISATSADNSEHVLLDLNADQATTVLKYLVQNATFEVKR